MKLKSKKSSTQPLTSEKLYEHFESITNDWTEAQQLMDDYWMNEYSEELFTGLRRPNPPTEEMVKKAQFVDKTYVWKNS